MSSFDLSFLRQYTPVKEIFGDYDFARYVNNIPDYFDWNSKFIILADTVQEGCVAFEHLSSQFIQQRKAVAVMKSVDYSMMRSWFERDDRDLIITDEPRVLLDSITCDYPLIILSTVGSPSMFVHRQEYHQWFKDRNPGGAPGLSQIDKYLHRAGNMKENLGLSKRLQEGKRLCVIYPHDDTLPSVQKFFDVMSDNQVKIGNYEYKHVTEPELIAHLEKYQILVFSKEHLSLPHFDGIHVIIRFDSEPLTITVMYQP